MNKLYLLLLLFIFLFSSCYKLFDYNFEKEKKICVNCILHSNDTVRVNLSYTFDINESLIDTTKYITNADVYIYEENEFKEKLKYQNTNTQNGWFLSETFIPRSNKKYKLIVVVVGYDTIIAETFIPEPIKIDTIISSNLNFTIDSHPNFEPPPDYPNMEPPPPDTSYSVDLSINFTDKKNLKNYFSFKSLNYYGNNGFISYDPVIETKNMGNAYVSLSTNLKDYDKLIFSDTLFSGENYLFRISDFLSFSGNENYLFKYQLSSLSKDAFLFYKTCFLQHKTFGNPLIEPVIIYSNIINGTGIFAGVSSNTDSVVIINNK